jgi:hypothetical protein
MALADHESLPSSGSLPTSGSLPELANVYWRPRATERSLTRGGQMWTAWSLAHSLPFAVVAVALVALKPVTLPVALILLAHAWVIPGLYAARGASVLRRFRPGSDAPDAAAERSALGLLADLLDHDARELHAATGRVVERGGFGVWVVGEKGALLVRPGARRVHCYCVRVNDPELPACDRISHLLLALRADEVGFVTVANLAFSGARWRLRRRLEKPARAALDAAVARA